MQKASLWSVKKRDWDGVNRLVNELGISPFSAQLLINRGIKDAEAARDFFETPLTRIYSLAHIPGCREAAMRILDSLRCGEKVMIYGDYDADGVTATSVMVKGLKLIGANVDYYIPDRFSEGYDLNEGFLVSAAEKGYSLVVTVDCGIKAFECIEAAKRLGLKIIVSDHHEPGESLPEPDVLINPKLNNDDFFRDLAGVGVAFAVVLALFQEKGLQPGEEFFNQLLELAAIGTIADSVGLIGCNRIIVKQGLKIIGGTSNTGLAALLEVEGLKGKEGLEAADISFKIAPCINAVGRIGDANDAVRLLVSDYPQEAWELAQKLHRDNSVRQNLDGAAYLEVLERVEKDIDFGREKVIVLASDEWHPGVIGITAARVAQRFHMPAVLISIDGEVGKGSGRSTGDFDLNEAFEYCRELLIRSGGHKLAGGFSIEVGNISAFRRMINDFADKWSQENHISLKQADVEVIIDEIDLELIQEIEAFKPFGIQNPEPIFLSSHVRVDGMRIVGKKSEHLKLVVTGEETQVDCIGFKMSEHLELLKQGGFRDIVFTPQLNTWNGTTKIEFLLWDIIHDDTTVVDRGDFSPKEKESSLKKDSLQKLLKGARVQYSGLEAEAALLGVIQELKSAETFTVVLFPLQSLAADFEKTLAGLAQGLRVLRVDCITANETIEKAAGAIAHGAADLLVTSLGTWSANKNLQAAAAGRNSCMCVHLGHWVSTSLPQEIFDLTAGALEDWKGATVFLGSGRGFDEDAFRKGFEIQELQRGQAAPNADLVFLEGEDKLASLQGVLRESGKQLVVVNNGRKAVWLAQEIKQMGLDNLKIRHFHGGLMPSQKRLVLEDFNFGTAGGLVASRNLEPYMVERPESVVIFSFPLNVFDFNRFIIAPRVFLGYNNADFNESYAYVRSLCPDEELIQEAGNAEQRGKINSAQLAKRMAEGLQRNGNSGKRGISVSLAIMGDLNSSTSGSFDRDSFIQSWRFAEACREVEAFKYLVDDIGSGFKEAAAAFDGMINKGS